MISIFMISFQLDVIFMISIQLQTRQRSEKTWRKGERNREPARARIREIQRGGRKKERMRDREREREKKTDRERERKRERK
jgi:hypothetical protein